MKLLNIYEAKDVDRSMDPRSRAILANIVDAYCRTGEPVGSKYLVDHYGLSLSSATIRSVMSELEARGLLFSPHTSAGRVPTQLGLRFFVRSVMEIGEITPHERSDIERSLNRDNLDWDTALENISETLSGISQCAGIVSAPKNEEALKQIHFVRLSSERVLVVLICENGVVENRIIAISSDIDESILEQAQNYLMQHLCNQTLAVARRTVLNELTQERTQLHSLSQNLVEKGLEIWSSRQGSQTLIVRGTANLVSDNYADKNIYIMRDLLQSLEDKEFAVRLLDSVIDAQGVQIFIGAENPLFGNNECSMVLSPYHNQMGRVVGVIGVVGPCAMQYNRVIPIVNYTAKLLTHVMM